MPLLSVEPGRTVEPAAGRMFSMPHASRVGMISAVVVFLAAVGYMVVPAMVDGVTGRGCL
jgi:hypothetical protein